MLSTNAEIAVGVVIVAFALIPTLPRLARLGFVVFGLGYIAMTITAGRLWTGVEGIGVLLLLYVSVRRLIDTIQSRKAIAR